MAANQIQVQVALAADGSDADALEECAGLLGDEIIELDVDAVESVTAGEAPPGAKGVELAVLGALVVKLARSQKLLGQVVEAVRDWLSRNNAHSVRMEIDGDVLELTGATESERRALVDAWVKRHGEP